MRADRNELFPDPVGPTTATNSPLLMRMLSARSSGFIIEPTAQLKLPFSTITEYFLVALFKIINNYFYFHNWNEWIQYTGILSNLILRVQNY